MPASKAQNAPALDAATLTSLGRNLGLFYVETLERPVPEQLLAILQGTAGPTFRTSTTHGRGRAEISPVAVAASQDIVTNAVCSA